MGNPAMRRWPWTLTLVLAAASSTVVCSNNTTTAEMQATTESVRRVEERANTLLSKVLGLPATMARVLKRIRESPHDYCLVDDVWFEKIPASVHADHAKWTSKSLPSPGDLFDMTDAVFDTHHLLWRNPILEGIDLKVYKDKSRRYKFDLDLNNGIADGKARNSGKRYGNEI